MSINSFAAFSSSIVRVYHPSGQVVGAGFLLSGQYILTCAHVVAQALGILETSENPGEPIIEVDFPLVEPGKKQKTKLSFWLPAKPLLDNLPQEGEDIAILELLPLENQPPEQNRPLKEVEFAPLAVAGEQALWEHPFRVFGFPSGDDHGVWATGTLSGRQARGWIQMEAVKVSGYPVEPGFSGAPIWDQKLGAVVGMAVAAEKRRQDVRAAFMIPTQKLKEWIPSEFLSGCQQVTGQTAFNQRDWSILNAFCSGDIVPFLGAGINLCDYPPQPNLIDLETALNLAHPGMGLPSAKSSAFCVFSLSGDWPPPPDCPFWGLSPTKKLTLDNERRLAFAKVNLRMVSQYMSFVNGVEFYDQIKGIWEKTYREQLKDPTRLRRVHDFFATLPQKMLKKGYRELPYRLIVTTNFDESLEEAFDAAGQPYDVIFYLAEDRERKTNEGHFFHRKYEGDISSIPFDSEHTLNFGKRPIILKLFGTWGREFVITEDHHITYLLKPDIKNALPNDLQTHLKKSRSLFLGYGLYDSDLLTVLHRVHKNEPFPRSQEKGTTSWIVHQSPVLESQGESLEARLWKVKKVDLIPSSLADFITNLEMGIEWLENQN